MAQRSGKPSERDQKNLKVFLQKYFGGPHWGSDKSISYSAAFVDLKGDGSHEVVVYVEGNGMCVSGGCVTMILEPTGSSYKQIGYVTISRPPIRVLASKTNGTVGKGVIDAADTTITAVGAGVALGAVALYDDTSTPKYLISYNELTSPITPNGGDITLVWNAGGIFSI